ncbi:MAG: hypothetical protein L0177_00840 [Chloroflexi bacterium]|nr:hypothetical protein [Chloroflexota bacterium]
MLDGFVDGFFAITRPQYGAALNEGLSDDNVVLIQRQIGKADLGRYAIIQQSRRGECCAMSASLVDLCCINKLLPGSRRTSEY